MATAVRESYAAAQERLEGYARSAEPDALRALADDVLSVAGLLAREPRLRRALADASRPAEARVELIRSLLAGKVGEQALDLLADLVGGRWSVPSELLDAVERIGVEALLAAAERADELADVEDELFRFGQIVSGDQRLDSALTDSTVDVARRSELLHGLLDAKARPTTVRLAELALAGFGGRSFYGSLTRLVEQAAARRDAAVAYVVSAVAPTEDEERDLVERLSRMYGRKISLKVDVNPAVIGGMSIRIGADLYDGTVQRRLAVARAALSK